MKRIEIVLVIHLDDATWGADAQSVAEQIEGQLLQNRAVQAVRVGRLVVDEPLALVRP